MNIIQRCNVTVYGEGERALVFGHGFGCSQEMWRLVAPSLAKDYRIVLFDLIGSGGSDTSSYDRTKYAQLEGHAKDVVAICKALDLHQPTFVGHSVSSSIGLLASVIEPSLFKSLVLVAPSPRFIDDQDYIGGFPAGAIRDLLQTLDNNFLTWAEVMAPVIMGNFQKPEFAAELFNSFCGQKPEIAKHFAQTVFLSDIRNDLSKVSVPSLILQCSDDAVAPLSVGLFLKAALKASTYKQLKATGHCPHVSAPEEVLQAIQEFIAA